MIYTRLLQKIAIIGQKLNILDEFWITLIFLTRNPLFFRTVEFTEISDRRPQVMLNFRIELSCQKINESPIQYCISVIFWGRVGFRSNWSFHGAIEKRLMIIWYDFTRLGLLLIPRNVFRRRRQFRAAIKFYHSENAPPQHFHITNWQAQVSPEDALVIFFWMHH